MKNAHVFKESFNILISKRKIAIYIIMKNFINNKNCNIVDLYLKYIVTKKKNKKIINYA